MGAPVNNAEPIGSTVAVEKHQYHQQQDCANLADVACDMSASKVACISAQSPTQISKAVGGVSPLRAPLDAATPARATTPAAPRISVVAPTPSPKPVSTEDMEKASERWDLEMENRKLRLELENATRDEEIARRSCEQDRLTVKGRLDDLEQEVCGWQDRATELETEVSMLKSALAAARATAAANAAAPTTSTRPAACSWKPSLSMPPLPATPSDPDVPRTPVDRTPMMSVGGSYASSQPSSPPLSPYSSPRARRPPASRITRQAVHTALPGAAFHSSSPNVALGHGSSPFSANNAGAWTVRGDVRSDFRHEIRKDSRTFGFGSTSPPKAAKTRSRSVPLALVAGEEVDTRPSGFLEAFGGFYKQLVQGTRCTGPDVLAVNERFVEIDLSAEFPPERREAQVDFLGPQIPHAANRRPQSGIEMTPDPCSRQTPATERSQTPQSVHHL